ncbi:Gfo/Idh/MocA family protein [Rothia nasisuis]|uniref:Gfo/Idh/MocA family protein n=1 Tax=Rothia nasisuis TaxID=2109647 RepID=UPI001F2F21E9|nr:Gfo/Idh/MocA family oxidoreductase [Rothia nasisuis]
MTTQRTIGVGLVSVGWMGKVHSRAYSSLPIVFPELGILPRLVIAADPVQERVDYAVQTLGYEEGTTDYHKVLNHPEVDVVSICAPNFLHAEIAEAAARAGKAFWVEKPAGRSATETQRMSDLATSVGVVSAVGFNYRSAPAIEYARELIANGELGRITNVRGSFFADYSAEPNGALSWRFIRDLAGSGVLGDLMGHLVDLAHYLVGPIQEVASLTHTVHTQRPKLPMGAGTHFAVIENGEMADVENEDIAALLVRFGRDNAIGTLEASRVSVGPRAQYSIEVYGTQGSLTWDFERMNELHLALNNAGERCGYTRIMAGPGFGEFSAFQPGAGTSMGYDDLKVIEAKKFLLAYLGYESQHASINDALAANRVLDAAEVAAQTNSWRKVETTSGTSAAKTPEP